MCGIAVAWRSVLLCARTCYVFPGLVRSALFLSLSLALALSFRHTSSLSPPPSLPLSLINRCVCDLQGRTGVIVCCYLVFSGVFIKRGDGTVVGSGDEMARLALDHFLSRRGEGVNYTCQERLVQYFAEARRCTV